VYRDPPHSVVDDLRLHGVSRKNYSNLACRHSFSSHRRRVPHNVAFIADGGNRRPNPQRADPFVTDDLVTTR
jgi:hypothetical protein